ncbi:hypothetical protein CPB97_001587 [Podila verticillata]|nr:hypothetical protein CPB97_001587 [Podila verticillata]
MSSSSSSSTTNNNTPHSNTDHTKTDQSEPHKPTLALPAPGDAEPGMNLEVNGKDIKLDILGPVVVNEDGTMSRIDNWAEMAEIEKANVRRILLKRNELRLKKLRAARDAEIANETASNKLE